MRADVLRRVAHALYDRPPGDGPDRELLRRFADGRDASAFEALVRRHGPMVWGVCRRAVRTHADAEDAFQATFAVLAARATAVRKPDALGCWLYGVADKVARRVRIKSSRTTGDVPDVPAAADDPHGRRELLAALDEELVRLPEKYRGPLVLCYLQERTQDEAAGQLRVSLSTLKRRLDAGRHLLRARLGRRGLDLAVVLAAAGAVGVAPAALPAAAVAGVFGELSGPVRAVTREVLFAMWTTKIRTWAAGLVVAAGVTGGAGHYAANVHGQGPGYPPPATRDATAQQRAQANSVKLAELDLQLAEAQLAEATQAFERVNDLMKKGVVSENELAVARVAVAKARIGVERQKVVLAAEKDVLARLDAPPTAPAPAQAANADPVPPPSAVTGRLVPPATAAVPPHVRKLREEQLKVARSALATLTALAKSGRLPASDEVVTWSKRVCDARTALDPADRLKAAQEHLATVKDQEAIATQQFESGRQPSQAVEAVRYQRIEAEIAVKEAEGTRTSRNVLPSNSRNAADNVRGVVTAVERSAAGVMVKITPGADGGLTKDATFHVVRTAADGTHARLVGMVIVVRADPKEAVGQFLDATGSADVVQMPQTGDHVLRLPVN